MPMRKKRRASPCDKCYGKFLDLDMFGEQITFNIDGRTHYNSCCGVLFTLAIIVIVILCFHFTLMRGEVEHDVPTIVSQVREDYFPSGRDVYQVRQDSTEEPFAFAVAVTS